MGSTNVIVEQLIESPWDAEEVLEPLSEADKAAIRSELLVRSKETDADSGVMTSLGQFPDDEVIEALAKVVRDNEADKDVVEAAAEAICQMGTPASKNVAATFLEHSEYGVVKVAIENLDGAPAAIAKQLLSMIDDVANGGRDILMFTLVKKLVEAAPTDPDTIAALSRHLMFGVKHEKTLMASNAMFDALIQHAPDSPVAQAAFEAALASGHEYGVVRGRAALALTGRDTATHVKELKKLKGLQPSSGSLRSAALKKLEAK